jgi:LCP family protein required for cell wall assembly
VPVVPEKRIGADAVSKIDPSPAPVSIAEATPTATLSGDPYAVLLLGYGGAGHDGAYLTDSLMVVIVDPTRKSLTLLSIPRDAWVPMAFIGSSTMYNKVNTAYALAQDSSVYPDRLKKYTGAEGPGTFAMDTVSRLVGIPIRYYLALDFQGFREAIDAVGGIDLDVPSSFAARYPANDDPTVDASWTTVKFVEGPQHLTGERAIEYARARETIDNVDEGTDFARSRRQRLIMQAFKARLFQPGGLLHLPQLLGIAARHVDTNYAIPDLPALSQLILDWKDLTFYQTALSTDNYLEDGTGPDGTYVVVPSSADHSWAEIRAFVRRLWADPAVGVAMANTTIVVENATGTPGVASHVSETLRKLGYQVGDPVSGSLQPRTGVLDHTNGKSDRLIRQLSADLKLGNLAVNRDTADSGDYLVLELGVDEASFAMSVSPDRFAPFSLFGVLRFGVWSSDVASPLAAIAAPAEPRHPTPVAEVSAVPNAPKSRGTARGTTTPRLSSRTVEKTPTP